MLIPESVRNTVLWAVLQCSSLGWSATLSPELRLELSYNAEPIVLRAFLSTEGMHLQTEHV